MDAESTPKAFWLLGGTRQASLCMSMSVPTPGCMSLGWPHGSPPSHGPIGAGTHSKRASVCCGEGGDGSGSPINNQHFHTHLPGLGERGGCASASPARSVLAAAGGSACVGRPRAVYKYLLWLCLRRNCLFLQRPLLRGSSPRRTGEPLVGCFYCPPPHTITACLGTQRGPLSTRVLCSQMCQLSVGAVTVLVPREGR